MNLKDFEYSPSEGLFERIEKRLTTRRIARHVAATVGIVVALSAVVYAVVFSKDKVPAVKKEQVDLIVPKENVAERKAVAAERDVVEEQQSRHKNNMVEESNVIVPPTGDNYAEIAFVTSADNSISSESIEQRELSKVKETTANGDNAVVVSIGEEYEDWLISDTPQYVFDGTKSEPDTTLTRRSFGAIAWVPNAIALNDENEKNRVFAVKFTESVSDFKIMIFNRSGRLVFESNDQGFVWDASYNGQAVGQGTYVWVMTFRDEQGKQYADRGTITVIR